MNDPCVECDSLEQRNQFFRKLYPQLDHLNEPLGQPPEEVPKASADDQLHHAQMRFKRLSEATSEGIVIVHDGVIVDVNQQFADMHGYRMEELIGKDGFQLLDAASQEKVRRNLADGYQGFYELVAVKKDGSVFPSMKYTVLPPFTQRASRMGLAFLGTSQNTRPWKIKSRQVRSAIASCMSNPQSPCIARGSRME